ncbi:MAG: ABC transporter [Anaerolineales bacterium]|nr:MAG: ABC transporter [Anaerolineales bacterium]
MILFSDLSFTYPGANQPVFHGVNLTIPDGALCLVMGLSGSGKSTLLRCINGLVPHFSGGRLSGTIRVDGQNPAVLSPREMSRTVGFVFQDPETQFVVDRVEDEIAFSLENAALARQEMENRVAAVLELLELTHLRTRRLETLSGGEIQRVAIAAALALRPRILVLDEPTSQLDPHGAEEVLEALVQLNKQHGLTVVLAEHRLERVIPHASQIVYLSEVVPEGLSGEPREVLSLIDLNPPLITLGKHFGWEPLPLTIEEASSFAQSGLPGFHELGEKTQNTQQKPRKAAEPLIQAIGLKVNFGDTQALRGVDFQLYPGEIAVMMGHNGAGKSTLLRTLVGLTPFDAGKILVSGIDTKGKTVAEICQTVGYLPQDPNALLFSDTVKDELLLTLINHQMDSAAPQHQPQLLLDRLGIGDKADCYPRDLSTGERQRVALGAVMVTQPGALLLDEPTRGLDYAAKQALLGLLKIWRDEGMAILLVTHDVEMAVQAADRVILLDNGLLVADGEPWEVLTESPTFAPQVARIFPHQGWLTVKDVIGEQDASQH